MTDCAIVIGHDANSQGAVATTGVTEWQWNSKLAPRIVAELEALGRTSRVILRPQFGNYTTKMQQVAAEVGDARCAIELHFNSIEVPPGKPGPQRTTALYWPGSTRGLALAMLVATHTADAIGGPTRVRSAREQATSWAGAPLLFLKLTRCPAVIAEPFFGCTPIEVAEATRARDDGRLPRAYAKAIDTFLREHAP